MPTNRCQVGANVFPQLRAQCQRVPTAMPMTGANLIANGSKAILGSEVGPIDTVASTRCQGRLIGHDAQFFVSTSSAAIPFPPTAQHTT
jgi:hypothetical protein